MISKQQVMLGANVCKMERKNNHQEKRQMIQEVEALTVYRREDTENCSDFEKLTPTSKVAPDHF